MQISEWVSLPDEEGESPVEVLAKRVVVLMYINNGNTN